MRPSYPVATLALLAASWLGAGPAAAQGTGVWIDCQHGNAFCGQHLDPLVDALEAVGASVTVDTDLDAAIADGSHRLVIVLLPTLAIDFDPVGDPVPDHLTPFLDQGGRLVVLGDNASEPTVNANVRALLDDLPAHGLGLEMADNNFGCDNTTQDFADHPLMQGTSIWHFARVNEVTGGTALIEYQRTGDGAVAALAAVAPSSNGEVVLFGDIEGFSMNCYEGNGQDAQYAWWNDHTPLWQALFTEGFAAPDPDNDGDGSPASEDCDDDDATASPDLPEDCGDGVDNDCDGDIDAADTDCAGDDDDDAADDDDVADDDDIVLPDDDDSVDVDLPPPVGGTPTGCCGSTVAGRGERTAAGLAIVLLLGWVRRRR